MISHGEFIPSIWESEKQSRCGFVTACFVWAEGIENIFHLGILSYFAVQAGAKKVYAVEASNMAQFAKVRMEWKLLLLLLLLLLRMCLILFLCFTL